MKQQLLHNWNFMRLLRLGLGVFIIVQAITLQDWTMGILGVAFTAMPIFNIGCCGAGNCYTPVKKDAAPVKEIVYEEVIHEK